MSIIHLLPDSVANQIAAGEVIQRPASVVKELVENSIDAGATQVQVLVRQAGKALIQVVDNGKGMSEDDARLAFERHATSKISSATDLFALSTMGFRGEALASIAAVAQVELRTRQAEQSLGVCLQIEGSRVVSQDATACPVGANFQVRNLFFNVPARRRFLKSDTTELSNIVTEFERVALAHPDVAFKLLHEEAVVLDLPAGNLRQRVSRIFGRKLDSQLLPVEAATPIVRISGFVGTPQSARKKNAHQFFFANRRFMRHPYFARAVQTAFERLLPQGEQVPFFIAFDVKPENIDVNIHPTKTEIKFADEQAVWQILLAAVREALGRFDQVPSIDFDTASRPDIPAYTGAGADLPAMPPRVHLTPGFNPFKQRVGTAVRRGASSWRELYDELIPSASTARPSAPSAPEAQAPDPDSVEAESGQLLFPAAPSTSDGSAPTGEYLQFQGRYIITAVKSGLMVVDLHRAHVRVLYEQYLARMTDGRIASQGLLFPQEFELPAEREVLFRRWHDLLTAAGFEVQPADEAHRQLLRGVPVGTEGLDPMALFDSVLDELSSLSADGHEADVKGAVASRLASTLARQAAMPVGVALGQAEMAHLMEQLFAGNMPGFTPDGKPVLTILPTDSIVSRF